MKKERRKLRDIINKKHLKSAIGTFLCLFAIMGLVNWTVVPQFCTWVLSFFFGSIFTYIVYGIIFLNGISLIFLKRSLKRNFDFYILGLIFIVLGIIITFTCNSMLITSGNLSYVNGGNIGSYMTFSGVNLDGTIGFSFSQAYSFSNDFSHFPRIDYSHNVGIIGILLTCIINSSMSDIGSYTIGGVLMCCGLVLILGKVLIKFGKVLSVYKDKIIKKEKNQKYHEAKDVNIETISLESEKVNKAKEEQEVILERIKQEQEEQEALLNKVKQEKEEQEALLRKQKQEKDEEYSTLRFLNVEPASLTNTDGLIKANFNPQSFGIKNEKVNDNNDDSSADEINEEYNKKKEYFEDKVEENIVSDTNIDEVTIENNEIEDEVKEENDEIIHEEPIIEEQTPIITQDFKENYVVKEEIKAKTIEIDVEDRSFESNENSSLEVNTLPKAHTRTGDFVFPSSSLLDERNTKLNDEANEDIATKRIDIINKLCNDFKYKAHVDTYTIGPSVTRYDLKPESDTSLALFDKLVGDLSARLGGINARFEPIVSGKTTGGIEIANAKSNTVSFKEVFEKLPDINGKKYCGMMIPFGKDIAGNCIMADFREFPHLLVCGTTGSGKSVFMHSILTSLIMRNTPDQLKLFVVDPKRVEFSKYKEIPHLLAPIITDYYEAYNGLLKIVNIMEERYSLLENAEVTDIKSYNKDYAKQHNLPILPYILVVLDEYSNLVDGCKKISEPVLQLAQKARACGIHLIISTQAPRTNIINGTIKANFPTRVALLCGSAVDSLNIIDLGGAEKLLGNGDMLIKSPVVSSQGLARVQGAFIDATEIKRVMDFLKTNYEPEYDIQFMDLKDHSKEIIYDGNNSDMEAADDMLYGDVRSFAMSLEYCSISKIQHTFSLGFGKAGNLFARLQREGILDIESGKNCNKGTKVIKRSPSSLETREEGSIEVINSD